MKGFWKMFSYSRAKTDEANSIGAEIREAVRQTEITSASLVATLDDMLQATNHANNRRGRDHNGQAKRRDN